MSTLRPSMLNLSRAFSSKLFVGGLSYHTTEEMLRKAFAEHGDVMDVRIITDRETGRSRGFGFITFGSDADAEAAKAKMSNHLLDGRYIRVDLASARQTQSTASPQPSGNAAISSSPSGFSFGTPGMRPPPVEDWGPLPFHGSPTASSQGAFESPASTAYQGNADALRGGTSPPNSTSCGQHITSISSNTAEYQSSSSVFEAQSSRFDTAASSNATSVTAEKTAVCNDGLTQPPNVSSSAVTPSATSNSYPAANISASTGQSFANRSSGEAGTTPAQTAKAKQENNFSLSSRTGYRSGGGGRPPSVLDLGSATYDFSNFPEFDASALKQPGESEEPKKSVPSHRNKLAPLKSETWQSKLTEEAIPPAQGPLFEFGLSSIPDSPPLLDSGYNPHGGLSLNLNLDELPEAEPVRLPYSIFTARTLPALDLPWLTPEADNWSPIGKPPRRIEDSPYSPFSPDLKDDPEFWWDPYDFDPEAKLLKAAFTEEPKTEVNATTKTEGEVTATKEAKGEAKKDEEPEAEANQDGSGSG
ncbi:hypothetical protein GOP47_0023003 [Adiantum capillus-veneris]|uniref:RRM domain-containing protein n=1 Tax=Adiantum capillus-veneris TaxID=13818 RepID=A0A9D4U6H3_ADICA|nr:hypothetical protein GOP47_0023003 [Adiantum capillus-veneris]